MSPEDAATAEKKILHMKHVFGFRTGGVEVWDTLLMNTIDDTFKCTLLVSAEKKMLMPSFGMDGDKYMMQWRQYCADIL